MKLFESNQMEELDNKKEENIKEENKQIDLREIVSSVIYVLVVMIFALLIVEFVGQRTVVSGSSMETTLSDGDNLIIDKISYRFREPERFDIVVFPDPSKPKSKTYFIKRVIGLPGETVQIDADGTIHINGEILEEDYGRETIQFAGLASEPIVLGEDEYFVLGDNRNNSMDSRFVDVGPVTSDQIAGRAICRIYPFSDIVSLIPEEE